METGGKDRYLSKRLQGLLVKHSPQPLFKNESNSQVSGAQDRSISSTDHDIRIFNHKKSSLKSLFRKDWNGKDYDKVSQSSYLTRTIKEDDGDKRGYDYQFVRNQGGLHHYRSDFSKKSYYSPPTKIYRMGDRDIRPETSLRGRIEMLEMENSRLSYERDGLEQSVMRYESRMGILQTHNIQLEEEIEEIRMSYERLMHEYRQLSLIHEGSVEKQRELEERVEILTDKNFKLQEMLYQNGGLEDGEGKGEGEESNQIQQILFKTQQSIDQYVIELDSLRELINQKEQSEAQLQMRIEQLQLEHINRSRGKDGEEIDRLNNIIETQRELQEALEEKIARLSSSTPNCQKCGNSLSTPTIPTSTSLTI